MNDLIKYSGQLFQVVQRKKSVKFDFNNEQYNVDLDYELIKRPPGVRAIIEKYNKILLNKEFRYELNEWDYRLPGGKIFDTLAEYKKYSAENSIIKCVETKLKEELYEEADIVVKNYQFLETSHCGFTVEWDLYYYLVNDFEETSHFFENNIQKNKFEYIQHCWVDYNTALKYCIEKRISEDRSSNVLLRYLLKKLHIGDN